SNFGLQGAPRLKSRKTALQPNKKTAIGRKALAKWIAIKERKNGSARAEPKNGSKQEDKMTSRPIP
ncbi:MAG TPA: hypothetical protein VGM32_03835, partial [Rhodopila sp.]